MATLSTPPIASRRRKSHRTSLLVPHSSSGQMYNSTLRQHHLHPQTQINLSTERKGRTSLRASPFAMCCCLQNAFNEVLFEEEFLPLPPLINDYLQTTKEKKIRRWEEILEDFLIFTLDSCEQMNSNAMLFLHFVPFFALTLLTLVVFYFAFFYSSSRVDFEKVFVSFSMFFI